MDSLRQALNQPNGKWKAALIPVLAGVLALVVWPKGDSAEIDELDRVAAAEPAADHSVDDSAPRKPKSQPLPDFDLETTLAHDPFAPPAALLVLTQPLPRAPEIPGDETPQSVAGNSVEESAVDEGALRAEQARKLAVSAIFVDAGGASALIGSQVVRPGDLLPDGLRVVAISTEGVTVRLEDRQNLPNDDL